MSALVKTARAIVKTTADLDAKNSFVIKEDFEANDDFQFEALCDALSTVANRWVASLDSEELSELGYFD